MHRTKPSASRLMIWERLTERSYVEGHSNQRLKDNLPATLSFMTSHISWKILQHCIINYIHHMKRKTCQIKRQEKESCLSCTLMKEAKLVWMPLQVFWWPFIILKIFLFSKEKCQLLHTTGKNCHLSESTMEVQKEKKNLEVLQKTLK